MEPLTHTSNPLALALCPFLPTFFHLPILPPSLWSIVKHISRQHGHFDRGCFLRAPLPTPTSLLCSIAFVILFGGPCITYCVLDPSSSSPTALLPASLHYPAVLLNLLSMSLSAFHFPFTCTIPLSKITPCHESYPSSPPSKTPRQQLVLPVPNTLLLLISLITIWKHYAGGQTLTTETIRNLSPPQFELRSLLSTHTTIQTLSISTSEVPNLPASH